MEDRNKRIEMSDKIDELSQNYEELKTNQAEQACTLKENIEKYESIKKLINTTKNEPLNNESLEFVLKEEISTLKTSNDSKINMLNKEIIE